MRASLHLHSVFIFNHSSSSLKSSFHRASVPNLLKSVCFCVVVVCAPALREKANLAVTVAGEEDQVLGHASFFDHPVGGLVDAAQWETFVQKHFGAGKCTVCECESNREREGGPCDL